MTEHNIVADLEPLAYPVDKLELLPGNPRKGNVDSVASSLKTFGQRKPIVAVKKEDGETGVVLAGNTTLKGARKLGWSHVAVTWVEDDDKTAAAFAIADNRTHDLGEYDDSAIVEMVSKFDDDDNLLEASGYDLMDIEELIGRMEGIDEEVDISLIEGEYEGSPDVSEEPKPPARPVIQYALVFDDEEQQQRWYAFVRWLKTAFPEQDSIAGRIDEYIQGIIDD